MKQLKLHFLADFEYYLKTERDQRQITVNKYIQRFRKPIRIALAEGYLPRDPFALHKLGRVKKEGITVEAFKEGFGSFKATEFVLYKSTLKPEGPVYERL